jgi:hypothetical protein
MFAFTEFVKITVLQKFVIGDLRTNNFTIFIHVWFDLKHDPEKMKKKNTYLFYYFLFFYFLF